MGETQRSFIPIFWVDGCNLLQTDPTKDLAEKNCLDEIDVEP